MPLHPAADPPHSPGRDGPPVPVVVAGHVCLDVIPALPAVAGDLAAQLRPGSLTEVGPALLTPGGAVSNVGRALHRLGHRVRLIGKVGDDLFGRALLDRLRAADPTAADGMLVVPGEVTSYTIVLQPPGADRLFLHAPGANATFAPQEIDPEGIPPNAVFHFGYPPLMRQTYADGEQALAGLFAALRRRGVFVSLDMAMPDPHGESGRVDWRRWLACVLPHVDLFAPGLEEIRFMLALRSDAVDGPLLVRLGEALVGLGARLVALKLGDQGLYLHTGPAPESPLLRPAADWAGRRLLAPCFRVTAAGTTGAGDATHAGLLAALVRGLGPEAAVTAAVAVGACSVEAADATTGIPPWDALQDRLRRGWPRRPVTLPLPGWSPTPASGLYHPPTDAPA